MKVTATAIAEVLIFEPRVHRDDRGYFLETYRESLYRDAGLEIRFVQENQSYSSRGTLRGLHYQLEHPQGKLVRVLRGEIYDVAVDLRRASPTFGRWVGVSLDADRHRQLWVPPGFAHGFCALSEHAEVAYKCSDYYHPQDERCLAWDDPDLAIDWPLAGARPQLSARDAAAPPLRAAETYP